MATQLNALGDKVFETYRIGGREWFIVEAAHTNGMLFYVRPTQWEEGEVAGALQFLAQCREEIEAMKVCVTDNVWFTTRCDEDEDEDEDASINATQTGAENMERTYEFKVMFCDGNVYTVAKFYRSPNLGQCHLGYLKIASTSESEALRIAKEAM